MRILFMTMSLIFSLSFPALSAEKPKGRFDFIAALGSAGATSGSGAQDWGIWYGDPATKAVWLRMYPLLRKMGGFTPANWQIKEDDWWLDENGLIMQPPDFPIKPGTYRVTGDREVTTTLTIYPPDSTGDMRWELEDGTLHDVTHLPCRSSNYTPVGAAGTCLPLAADRSMFPIPVGQPLPELEGCVKQDYAVLIVLKRE